MTTFLTSNSNKMINEDDMRAALAGLDTQDVPNYS
jgi:hypothetical protein